MLNSARLGTKEYDFDSKETIKKGGQAVVFAIKCKIDGKIYACKRLPFRVGSKNNIDETIATAEREIRCLRDLNHPMII